MNAILCNCGHYSKPTDHTTGFAQRSGNDETICFECCAYRDLGRMLLDGNTRALPFYLTRDAAGQWTVANWPGTLRFKVINNTVRKGRHNIAQTREDVWFVGPDLHVWHGICIGDWTQIVHCKRTKERWRKAVDLGYTSNGLLSL